MKKIGLSKKDLSEKETIVNEFLSKKGLAAIQGGYNVDWGNSNYAESTYVRK